MIRLENGAEKFNNTVDHLYYCIVCILSTVFHIHMNEQL